MEEELNSDIIKATQLSLGKFVKRPPLSEKLLKKPPFRFLHDIIITVLKTTGFFEGLFTEEELISENVKDRESKIQFLNKAITVLCLTTEKTLTVKPSKIVAGHEPHKTNEFLQCLGQALEKKLSSTEAVRKYQEKVNKNTSDKKSKSSEKLSKKSRILTEGNGKNQSKEKDTKTVSKIQHKEITNKKESPPKKIPNTSNLKEKANKSPLEKESYASIESNHDLKSNIINESVKNTEKSEKEIDLASNEINQNKPVISNEETLLLQKEEEVNIVDINGTPPTKFDLENSITEIKLNQNDNIDHAKVNETTKVKYQDEDIKTRETSLVNNDNKNDEIKIENIPISFNSNSGNYNEKRPQSVRPSSSRPGAPRIKEKHESALLGSDNPIVHKVNIITESSVPEEEEENNVIIVNDEAEVLLTSRNEEQMKLSSNQHGHLVQQILDSQKEFSQISGRTEIEWQFEAQKSRDVINQEIEQIRFNVQALSRISNPLGKLIDHIQEDVEVMRQELQEWMSIYENTSKELSKQKSANAESLQPLEAKMKQLDADIEEKRDKINDLRIVVYKNYYRIEKLLSSGKVQ